MRAGAVTRSIFPNRYGCGGEVVISTSRLSSPVFSMPCSHQGGRCTNMPGSTSTRCRPASSRHARAECSSSPRSRGCQASAPRGAGRRIRPARSSARGLGGSTGCAHAHADPFATRVFHRTAIFHSNDIGLHGRVGFGNASGAGRITLIEFDFGHENTTERTIIGMEGSSCAGSSPRDNALGTTNHTNVTNDTNKKGSHPSSHSSNSCDSWF